MTDFQSPAHNLRPLPMPAALPAGAELHLLIDVLSLDASALDDEHFIHLWSDEEADLLNPYFEDPSDLFAYEVDDANEEIWARSAGGPRADRAMTAAEECLGINREALRRERYANYRTMAVLREVATTSHNAAAKRIAITEIGRMQHHQEPFAGMRRWFARQWGLPDAD